MLTESEFIMFHKEGFNWVPVWKKINIQDISALDIYQALKTKKNSYLFEVGASKKEIHTRAYSVIGLQCDVEIQVNGSELKIFSQGQVLESIQVIDSLEWIRNYLKSFKVPAIEALYGFTGGLFGFFGFNTVNMIEKKLSKKESVKKDLLKHPDIILLHSKELIIIDHNTSEVTLIVYQKPHLLNNYGVALARLHSIEKQLLNIKPSNISMKSAIEKIDFSKLDFLFSKDDFEKTIFRVKEYIKNGDVMQVVLSHCISRVFKKGACSLYRALRKINVSPYGYLIDFGSFQIVGSSPQALVKCLKKKVIARPLGGTRPRGIDQHEDALLNQELISNIKENAEHIMLVDLARNDLGRISTFGTIHLEKLRAVEKFSHVMHLVSTVTGNLENGKDVIDVLRAVFPAGTLSGAPKIKALEIIHELEPFSRGIYGGGIGYLDWHGSMDLAIAIRTGLIQNHKLYVQAGASIVADSDPFFEWQETCNKAKALLAAAVLAEQSRLT